MPTYIENTLGKNERILYRAYVSKWSMAPLITLGILTIGGYGIGLIFFALAWLRYTSTELAITTRKVVAKFGVIRRETIEIRLDRIESVQVNQSTLGRMFDFGSIIVSGAGTPNAPIPGISNPLEFRRWLMDAQDGGVEPEQTIIAK